MEKKKIIKKKALPIKKKKPVQKKVVRDYSKYTLIKPVYKKGEDGMVFMKIDPRKNVVVGLELNTISRELKIRVAK